MSNINLLKQISSFVILLLLTGCAAIISPQTGSNILNSEPGNVDVYDGNNSKLGTTPFDLTKLSKETQVIRMKKDGYLQTEFNISRKANNTAMFLDAMLLCIPCPFENDKNLYHFEPVNPTVKLRKELKERDNNVNIAIDKIVLESKNSSIGKINKKPKKIDDKGMHRIFGEVDEGDGIVKTAFEKSYLQATYLSNAESIKSAMARPRILLKPVVTEVSMDLKGSYLYDMSGPSTISCNWEVYKISDKTKKLASFQTQTALYRNPGSSARIFDALIFEAALDFLENDSLYDYLRMIEKEYLSDSKGNEIRINASPAVKYTTMKDALKNAKPAVVTVLNSEGFGSGFIISTDGYIITNYHVVKDEKSISVKLESDLKMKAQLVKSNKEYDLALLKIEAEDLKTIPIGNSDDMESGDEVYAIGTPMETNLGQTVTKGIISGKRDFNGMKFLQTDVSINPGNSGGPLINVKGEMIGITTMKLGNGTEGIGFCIPSNVALEMLNIKF